MDYPFTILEIRLNAKDEGEGKIFGGSKVYVEKGELVVENWGTQPTRFTTSRSRSNRGPMSIRSAHRATALVVAAILAVTPVFQALPAAAPQAKPATAKPATATGLGWPRNYSTPSGGRVIVYEPQIASWANQKALVAYAAASYQAKGAAASAKPAIGSIKLEAESTCRWRTPVAFRTCVSPSRFDGPEIAAA